jgi:hypothetical protein
MSAALLINNLIDSAVALSAAGSVASSPPEMLREEHVSRKWRHNATSSYVLADLGASNSIDTVALLGMSGGASATFQIKLSLTDPTAVAGEVYTSSVLSGSSVFDSDYQVFGHMLPDPLAARYVRIDLSQPGVSYIEAGRWVVGSRHVFETNYQAPWARTARRNSVDTIGFGGQTFVDRRSGYWMIDAHFEFLTETDRAALLEEIGIVIVNNGHKDILWINDVDTTSNARDFIWGYVDGDFRMTQSLYTIPAFYSVEFPIRQRL